MVSAFEVASGVPADHLSLLIRSIVCSLFYLWAAWFVYGQIQSVQNQSLDIYDLPMRILRILILCAVVTTLVFLG